MSKCQRRSDRADLNLLYVNKIVGDEPHLARARDISADGVYLYKLLEPEITHGKIGLELMLPDGKEVIWAVGEVVRKDDEVLADGMAVRFVRIAEADRRRIRRYVAEALAESTSKGAKTAAA